MLIVPSVRPSRALYLYTSVLGSMQDLFIACTPNVPYTDIHLENPNY